MRRLTTSIVIALVAASCRDASIPGSPFAPAGLRIRPSPQATFMEVTSGQVTALVPDGWDAVPIGAAGLPPEGFFASPDPSDWRRADGSVEGMAALWVDVARVGVPSDYYYLAATGPALERLTESPRCRPASSQVFVDHEPAYLAGPRTSPGDYVARGQGTCRATGVDTRWAYFVAAPGLGPIRRVGIPSSGLYMVVAVMRNSRQAGARLRGLLRSARFGGAGVTDFIAAARG